MEAHIVRGLIFLKYSQLVLSIVHLFETHQKHCINIIIRVFLTRRIA